MNFSKIAALVGLSFIGYLPCLAGWDPSEFEPRQFHSQVFQDRFAYLLLYKYLNKQDPGYYLEVGAGHPIAFNNSYYFENQLSWRGISIDLSEEYQNAWRAVRKNSLRIEDATQTDYESILSHYPQSIDYLSIDIDINYHLVLERIPFDKHRFKVITIEHDYYKFGDRFREMERKILSSLGYHLLCPDVSTSGASFEDWWIDPNAFPPHVFSELVSLDLKRKNYDLIVGILLNH